MKYSRCEKRALTSKICTGYFELWVPQWCEQVGYQPQPKMVTNSLGKRNFMQPMGRPKHALKVHSFLPWFPMCSHYVPFKFAMGFCQVLNMFPKFSMCSPTCSPQHGTFIPYALANVVVLSPIQVGQREGTPHFTIEGSIW